MKLKSQVDQQELAIAKVGGVCGVDNFYDNLAPIGFLKLGLF